MFLYVLTLFLAYRIGPINLSERQSGQCIVEGYDSITVYALSNQTVALASIPHWVYVHSHK